MKKEEHVCKRTFEKGTYDFTHSRCPDCGYLCVSHDYPPTLVKKQSTKQRKLTAYLRFSGFEAKAVMYRPQETIRIPVLLPLSVTDYKEIAPPNLNTTPILVFKWRKQLTRYTHEYSLRSIDL